MKHVRIGRALFTNSRIIASFLVMAATTSFYSGNLNQLFSFYLSYSCKLIILQTSTTQKKDRDINWLVFLHFSLYNDNPDCLMYILQYCFQKKKMVHS